MLLACLPGGKPGLTPDKLKHAPPSAENVAVFLFTIFDLGI
jgi:hypothetical protein